MAVTVGLHAAVERLHFLFGRELVASRLLLQQAHAMEEEVGGQQEARQREDEQAQVNLGRGRGGGTNGEPLVELTANATCFT